MRIHQLGFTLIEVLVSLAIFVLILLSFDRVQGVALQASQSAYFLMVASQQAVGIGERLRALGDGEGLMDQVLIWQQENQHVLPNSQGSVSGHYPNYVIRVGWGRSKKCYLDSSLSL